jgi:hypothetical protein
MEKKAPSPHQQISKERNEKYSIMPVFQAIVDALDSKVHE